MGVRVDEDIVESFELSCLVCVFRAIPYATKFTVFSQSFSLGSGFREVALYATVLFWRRSSAAAIANSLQSQIDPST